MFDQPAKGDVDYALTMLMHEARRRVADEKNRIKSEAIKAGALQSNRVVVTIADAADKIHAASMTHAGKILIDFIQRMDTPSAEVVGWARPHLENLSIAVLGGVPPNGFPDDHQRIIRQYQAVFGQRVEGTLREVQIGYARDTGFSSEKNMADNEEWISASSALALLGMPQGSGSRTICKRAHVGMIKARAHRFIRDGKSFDDVDVPTAFWWAGGERALTQNWRTGDFETWIKGETHLQAFGVTFRRSDIELLKPAEVSKSNMPSASLRNKIFIGHGRSPMWRELKDYLREQLNLDVEEFRL